MLGKQDLPEVTKSLDLYRQWTPKWERGKDSGGTYGWYYTTQAMFHRGGHDWATWNRTFLPMLIKHQDKDGHWSSNSTHSASPVYDTVLCCLCLQVYYRYPRGIFDRIPSSIPTGGARP